MKVVLQRVKSASVKVEGEFTAKIRQGLLALVCAEPHDTEENAAFFARKIAAMRIFTDSEGKMNLSIKDIGGDIIAVSQFTLAAEWQKGNRPGFSKAAPPSLAEPLYNRFCELLENEGLKVGRGVFGAHMEVELINDGPVTIVMEQ